MKYLIWGAGRRGERVLRVVGESNIIAYIDINKDKIGKKYYGKEVISFEEYLDSYVEFFLIISPREYRDIVDFLKSNEINQYFIFVDCPSEVVWDQGEFSIKKFPLYNCKKEECIAIYGINLFSIMLYDFMKEHEYEQLFFIASEKCGYQGKLEQLGYKFESETDRKDKIDRILITNSNFERAITQYKNCKIDDFYDFSYQLSEYRNIPLSKFKNLHHGQRCFIVATGPSLCLDDLECLRRNNEITMSVNMVYKAFPLVKWRPDYYVMADLEGARFYEKELKQLNLPNMFITDIYPDFWKNELSDNFYKYHGCSAFSGHNVPKFSDDIVKCIYSSATVIYVCLQLAIYMGFKEIYIIGADCNYKKDAKASENHFVKNYYHRNDNQATEFALEEAFLEYQVARRYAELHEIKIYNATRGGKLEVFERIDFDSLF